MSQSQWSYVMSRKEVDAYHALTASLDPSFARREREFYESASVSALQAVASQAWNCCEPTGYQLARSYAALKES